jgi:serine/threonine-protein kinase
MAEVYVAYRNAEGKKDPIVLKRIRPDHAENDEYLKRFVLEAQVASRLSHNNLVRFHEFGKVGDCHYIAMELVSGYSVARLLECIIEDDKPPPLAVALHIGIGILDGLSAMHGVIDERGKPRPMLHRDITPNNVIVTHQGRPVVIDFGIAKDVLGPQITLPGKVIGTARYMAPEHRRAEFIDPRADIFSASVILFELLVGRHPWPPLESVKELLRVSFDAPDVPPEVRSRIPEDVLAVVLRGLECEPQKRFADAKAMGDALRACASFQSVGNRGNEAVRVWTDSLGIRPDQELETPVIDHAPASSEADPVWSSSGIISQHGIPALEIPSEGEAPAHVLSVPPLPPPRESVLVTADIHVDVPGLTGRPVWVSAVLITALAIGLLFAVIWIRGLL